MYKSEIAKDAFKAFIYFYNSTYNISKLFLIDFALYN